MAKIEVRQFGGIQPSVNPRNLQEESAQTAENLILRYGDFRPMDGVDATDEGAPGGEGDFLSIYKTADGEWLTSDTDTNYVASPVNDTDDIRTYLTGRSAYPEAYENSTYRRLGVPRPSAAPALTVNVVDEFSSDELGAALPAILDQIESSIRDNLTATRLGSEPTLQTPPDLVGGDPFYSNVWLHLQMNGTVGSSAFVDSSRFVRSLTTAGVTLQTPSGLTGGDECGRFTGARGITFPEIKLEADQNWQIDLWFKPTASASSIQVASYRGYVQYVVGAGNYSLFGMGSGRSTNDSVKITSSSPPTTGVWQKLTLQNRASTDLRLFLAGSLVGSTTALGIRFSAVGWVGSGSGYVGDMDEVRLTVDTVRTDQTDVTAVPFGTGYSSGGFWLEHGTVTTPALPTSAEGDWAYLLPMVVQDGQYLIASEPDRYLQNASFNGRRVNYSGSEWWAVPMSYQAVAQAANEAAIATDLKAILNPATGGQLIPDDIADQIADEFADKVDQTEEPVATYLTRINSAQDTIDTQLASVDVSPSKLTATLTSVGELNAATRVATNYFANLLATLNTYAQTVFDTYIRGILPESVDRIIETRAYVYTYVTDWGEESQPSPASVLVEADQNDTVTVVPTAPPGGRHVVGWRLYRSSTTNVGAAYQLIADKTDPAAVLNGVDFDYFAIGTLTYTDDQAQEELQENCQTITWAEPVAEMIGLVGMPNGILAGFFESTVCFSEPFAPYAWPVEYQITTKWPVVGLGVFGQTLVVLTEGHPYYISGADSASMSAQELETPQAGAIKRSIVSSEGGVFYVSPDGLCVAAGDGVSLLSSSAYSREDWQDEVLSSPADVFGVYYENVYYLFLSNGAAISFDLFSKRIGTVLLPDGQITAAFNDLSEDKLYAWDSSDGGVVLFRGAPLTGTYRTKIYVRDNFPGFGWVRVNGPGSFSVDISLYRDGTLFYQTTVAGREPVRLPAGRAREWEVVAESNDLLVSVVLATDVKELL